MGTSCQSNLGLPRHNPGYTSLRGLAPRQTGQNHIKTGTKCSSSSQHSSWQRQPRLRTARNWNSLSSVRRRDGNVPRRRTCVHHHAHRQMVQQRLPALHQKAGQAILQTCRETDDHVSIVSDSPRHCPTSRIERGPQASQPSRQCQDKEEYWT